MWRWIFNASKGNNHGNPNFLDEYDFFVETLDDSLTKSKSDHYLEEKVLPRTPHFDILAWWKSGGLRYPTLRKIAKDILVVLIFTIALESSFSTSGRLGSPHCSRLHANTLEALMCAQN
ncbi:hypothetical protein REPUB_Repub17cG0032000 [Reevesia pubescens]